MDQHIKQRLVGIAVVFSLAVIFLPMLLDGSGFEKKNLEIEIPEQPMFETRTDFDQKIIELRAKVNELPELTPRFVDENTRDTENRINRQTDKKPVKTKQETSETRSGGDSWILQAGSFKDRKKAMMLRDKLRQSKIAAVFIEQFSHNGEINYRVRLGPFLNHRQSKIAQNKIQAKYNIDSLILKYER